MRHKITRRDFLNGTQIAIGASIAGSIGGRRQVDARATRDPFALDAGYYPPSKTELRGSTVAPRRLMTR